MKKSKKLKLLFISQCFPLPLDGGGKIKTFNTLKTLSEKYDIFATFISERKPTRQQLTVFRNLGVRVKIFYTDIMSKNIKENYIKLAWNYAHLTPHYVYQYDYLPAKLFIKEKIKEWQPDIIHVDHIGSSQFLPYMPWLKKNCQTLPVLILENHNVDHLLFFTRYRETRKLIRKLYLLLEGSLNWWYGKRHYPRYDHIFSISETETAYLKSKYQSVSTQPLVYPIPAARIMDLKKYDILFVGYLEWPANEMAVRWFIEDIFPKVLKEISNATFHVVGKKNKRLKDLMSLPQVVFHGYQANLDAFLGSAKLMVLPFKTGAGVRIKTLTALRNGIPIVSTSFGVGGLGLTKNREYLEANTMDSFASAVASLLHNRSMRERMGTAGKMFFKHNFGNDKNAIFLRDYEIIMARFGRKS